MNRKKECGLRDHSPPAPKWLPSLMLEAGAMRRFLEPKPASLHMPVAVCEGKSNSAAYSSPNVKLCLVRCAEGESRMDCLCRTRKMRNTAKNLASHLHWHFWSHNRIIPLLSHFLFGEVTEAKQRAESFSSLTHLKVQRPPRRGPIQVIVLWAPLWTPDSEKFTNIFTTDMRGISPLNTVNFTR